MYHRGFHVSFQATKTGDHLTMDVPDSNEYKSLRLYPTAWTERCCMHVHINESMLVNKIDLKGN